MFKNVLIVFAALLFAATIAVVMAFVDMSDEDQQIGLFMAGLMFLLLMGIGFVRLKFEITIEGVSYHMFPMLRTKSIEWSNVKTAYIRKYRPVREYGGWGIRYGLRWGKALNVTGNMGLQLIMKDGSKLLLGTIDPDGISDSMATVYKEHPHLKNTGATHEG